MEAKGGKKKSSSSSLMYEVPLGYSIEDVRPNGGIKKFKSAAYSNCVRKPSRYFHNQLLLIAFFIVISLFKLRAVGDLSSRPGHIASFSSLLPHNHLIFCNTNSTQLGGIENWISASKWPVSKGMKSGWRSFSVSRLCLLTLIARVSGPSRAQIDEFLSAAECTIVDSLSNSALDSYVLSESSLFVYPYKVIIKTCGTTKLLRSIPVILKHAGTLSLAPISVKYSRGTFIFPGNQPSPHTSFTEEVVVLNNHFAKLFGKPGNAYVINGGNPAHDWHIYWSSVESITPLPLSVEMCMTNLDRERASVFYKNFEGPAKSMTDASGIRSILPGFDINDFEFEPCGYSMNSIKGKALSTIHVTPEDGFSYASFEFVDAIGSKKIKNAAELEALIDRVLDCFGPEKFSLAIHCDYSSLMAMLSLVREEWDVGLCMREIGGAGTLWWRLPDIQSQAAVVTMNGQ
ncbi:S-adenosylmethionine decarboxylase proenzyme [Nymphaea thermarum]|nr:S-adenosylmethionine decarboxylase proenzyme [Nymphaea thermarum]